MMTKVMTKPLHNHFGVEVEGIDLKTVTADNLFPELRLLFEQHSMLLFREQNIDENTHIRIADGETAPSNASQTGP